MSIESISKNTGLGFQTQVQEQILSKVGTDLEMVATAISSGQAKDHSPAAVALANLVTDQNGNVDKGLAAYLGELFKSVANKVDAKQESTLDATKRKQAELIQLALQLRLPIDDLSKIIRVWKEGDVEPLNGYDAGKKENYFVLKVGDKEYTVEVYRKYQSNVVKVDNDNQPIHKGDAMDIQGIESIGEYSLQYLMASSSGNTVDETVFQYVVELDKRTNP